MVAATAAHADAGIQVEAGGMSFPLVRTFWTGDAQRNLGAAVGFCHTQDVPASEQLIVTLRLYSAVTPVRPAVNA